MQNILKYDDYLIEAFVSFLGDKIDAKFIDQYDCRGYVATGTENQ